MSTSSTNLNRYLGLPTKLRNIVKSSFLNPVLLKTYIRSQHNLVNCGTNSVCNTYSTLIDKIVRLSNPSFGKFYFKTNNSYMTYVLWHDLCNPLCFYFGVINVRYQSNSELELPNFLYILHFTVFSLCLRR